MKYVKPFRVALCLFFMGAATHTNAMAVAPFQQEGASLAGVIRDSSGAPVVAARVRILELHREDMSHGDGTYVLRNLHAGRYTLVVQRIGYRALARTITLEPGVRVSLDLVLVPAVIQLAPQIVTGAAGERNRNDLISSSSTLADAALERMLAATVAATLASQPGVSVSSVGPATARPVLRGLGGDRLVMLEDGQRPGDLSSTSGDHAVAIDPLTARRIEVVRGPMSLLYGSSALGGVVNVIREEIPRSRPEHWGAVTSMQAESATRGTTAGAEFRAPLGSIFAMRAEASTRHSGELDTPIGRMVNSGGRSVGAAAGLSAIGEHGHAGVSYRYYDNNYGIPGGFIGGHPGGVNIDMKRNSVRAEGEYHFDDAPIATLNATASYTSYSHNEREKGGRIGTAFSQEFIAGEVVARHDRLGPFTLGAAGMRFQYRDITTGGSLRTPSTHDISIAGYAIEEFGTERLRWQVGARYDWSHVEPKRRTFVAVGEQRLATEPRTFGAITGSLGALYVISDNVRAGASISRSYRTPDFNELFSNGPHLAANAYEVGDPSLGEETGVGGDAFVRIGHDDVSWETSVFHNRLNGYIAPSSRGRTIESAQGRPLFQYTNDNARFTGAESQLHLAVTQRLGIDAVVSYVHATLAGERPYIPVFTLVQTGIDTTYVAGSKYPILIPPLNGRVDIKYDRTRFFGTLVIRTAAAQKNLGDFESPTAGFAVAHIDAGLRMLRGKTFHSLTLRIDNVFDVEYREHLSRTRSIVPEPGRNISLLYRVSM